MPKLTGSSPPFASFERMADCPKADRWGSELIGELVFCAADLAFFLFLTTGCDALEAASGRGSGAATARSSGGSVRSRASAEPTDNAAKIAAAKHPLNHPRPITSRSAFQPMKSGENCRKLRRQFGAPPFVAPRPAD